MRNDLQMKLKARIQEVYGLSEEKAWYKAEELMRKCPDELLPNIYEWSGREKLSDIFVGKYSIPMIMAIWKNEDFMRALNVMTEFKNGDRNKAERQIWRMRK